MWILRALMLLALVVWIGGIVFFAFVIAPALFTSLPTPQLAGNVVSIALNRLHLIGLTAGVVFLTCSVVYNRLRYEQLRLFNGSHFLLLLMLLMTAVSQFGVTPRLRELRRQLSTDTAQAAEFDRLHLLSTRLEGGVLLCGLGLVALTARRFGNPGT